MDKKVTQKPVQAPSRPVMRVDANASQQPYDPLVSCLQHITARFGMPFSWQGTIAGLPLDDNGRLNLQQFARAATRSGLTASVVRKKPSSVAPMIVPFIA
ncbi:MAG: hypothetical protein WBD37_09465, partial [Anderseniella sp.]